MGPADADVVQVAGVAQGDGAGGADAVGADAVLGVGGSVSAGAGFGPGGVGGGRGRPGQAAQVPFNRQADPRLQGGRTQVTVGITLEGQVDFDEHERITWEAPDVLDDHVDEDEDYYGRVDEADDMLHEDMRTLAVSKRQPVEIHQ